MDTLEATTTVLNLWPTSFRGEHWRNLLAEELETWDGLERRQVIERLKVSHNAKRISLETMKQVRSGLGRSSKSPGSSLGERERVASEWLASEGLLEAYLAKDYGDRLMVERLIWSLLNRPRWEDLLSRQAGPAKYWQPWQRIDHLIFAATKATADGAPLCYPKQRGTQVQPWQAPMGNFVLGLPPLPIWQSDEDRRGKVNTIFAIANKFGGFKLGNFGRIFASKEYQAYLADFEQRQATAFERQHGAARDDGELNPPATRPLDIPKNIPPERQMIAKRRPLDFSDASPEFRALVGLDPLPDCGDTSRPPPNPAANQTTSPPTASESFDDAESLRS